MFKFRLSNLLLVITAAGVAFCWWAQHLRRERSIEHAATMISEYAIYDPDPTELIRTVNFFHSLGRNDALKSLRRFTTKYGAQQNSEDEFKLKLIVSLLFRPRKSGDKLPTWDLTQHSADAYKLSLGSWDSSVIELDGIPFETEFRGYTGTGVMPTYLIAWAAKEAEMRDAPIRPCPNPAAHVDEWLTIVSKLESLAPYRNEQPDFDSKVERLIKRQVFKMMSRAWDSAAVSLDKDWDVKYDQLRSTHIDWDSTIQSYCRTSY